MPEAPHESWWLRPLRQNDPNGPRRYEIGADGLTVGRAASNDIVVDSEAHPQVSSHHLRIIRADDGSLVLRDLNSLNGTLVNDHREAERALRDGDVVQLGRDGPAFVLETDGHPATVMLDGPADGSRGKDLSQTTVERFRRAIGLPEDADVSHLVQATNRSARRWVLLSSLLAATFLGAMLYYRSDQSDALVRISQLNLRLQADLAEAKEGYESNRREWEAQKDRLQEERTALQTRIQELARRGESSATELAALRQSFADTSAALERYNPVNMEAARLQRVQRMLGTVVFIETRLRFRSSRTNLLLRESQAEDDVPLNFDESRAPFEHESSGSGFCVSPDGWIITNRHVVHPKGHDTDLRLTKEEVLMPELTWTVLFSGFDRRHEARLVKVLDDRDDDLALLKIEPFEGLRHIDDFSTSVPVPGPGAEVYLHGFPLGRMAIQDGDKVVASSFRGILSRRVAKWLQVDAAVHPGNSGGPLTDAAGRVIGVVCRVQRISDEALAPDMGYAIPIARVAGLWPPDGH